MEIELKANECGFACRKQILQIMINRVGWGTVLSIFVLLALAVYSPSLSVKTLGEAIYTLLTLSPFLIASFTLAGYTKAASIDLLVTRAFHGHPALVIMGATLVAVLTPLCSCSVIPLITVLLRAGVPLSAVMAFWVGSPVISPDLFIYTWGVLGIEIATARFCAAVLMALIAGFVTLFFERFGLFMKPLRGNFEINPVPLGVAIDPVWKFWREPARVQSFIREFKLAARFVLPWMFLAFIFESLIASQVSAEVVSNWIGQGSRSAIMMAVAIGIPTYVNGAAAVPVVHGLMSLGMSAAAALAYLTAGSITTIPAIMAVLPLVRFRVFVWHLIIGLVGAIAAAYLYQFYLYGAI